MAEKAINMRSSPGKDNWGQQRSLIFRWTYGLAVILFAVCPAFGQPLKTPSETANPSGVMDVRPESQLKSDLSVTPMRDVAH